MTALIYCSMLDLWSKGAIDFDTDTFRGMLVTDAYVADQAAHDYRNDVTNQISATGYTAGGAIVSVTSTKNTGAKTQTISFGLASWPDFVGTANAIVYYKARGGASSADELCVFNSFDEPVVISDLGTFIASPTVITLAIR
jgi:cephalosporin-C deacetylase-like acetyl esterase